MCTLIEHIRFFYFTYFSWFVFGIKVVLDDAISYLLGFLLAAQLVGDYNAMRRAYIVCIIIIIIIICADKVFRNNSKTFDLLATLVSPINAGQRMRKIVYYRVLNHTLLLGSLILMEVVKILAAIFCIIDLAIEIKVGVFLNYVLLGILTTSSILGLFLYSTLIFHVMCVRDFYKNWLLWIGEWYLDDTIRVKIELVAHKLSMEFEEIFTHSGQ